MRVFHRTSAHPNAPMFEALLAAALRGERRQRRDHDDELRRERVFLPDDEIDDEAVVADDNRVDGVERGLRVVVPLIRTSPETRTSQLPTTCSQVRPEETVLLRGTDRSHPCCRAPRCTR